MYKEISRSEIIKKYIAECHIFDIESVIKSKNLVIGFRKTGEDAINWIQNHEKIAKKPHTILDKSLKKEEWKNHKYDERYVALIPYRGEDFVNGKPFGLYLSNAGIKYFKDNSSGIKIYCNVSKQDLAKDKKRKGAYFISTVSEEEFEIIKREPKIEDYKEIKTKKEMEEKLREDKEKNNERRFELFTELLGKLYNLEIKQIAQFFVTGDYDIHDMILGRSIVPSSSLDDLNISYEKQILNWLSFSCVYGVAKLDHNPDSARWQKKFTPSENSPIQHGCQYNYIAHMMNNEKDKAMMLKVAGYDDDVVFYIGNKSHDKYGKWIRIFNDEDRKKQANDLQSFYSSLKIKLKWTWEDVNKAEEFLNRIGYKYI